jgi:hypothetical protein
MCQENSSFLKNWTRRMGALNEDKYAYLIKSRSLLLRMRNVSGLSCREK